MSQSAAMLSEIGGMAAVMARVALNRQREAEQRRDRMDNAIDSFAYFVRYFWDIGVPSDALTWGRHMQAICDECQAVIEESARRRAVHTAIMAEFPGTEEGMDLAAARIDAELGGLPPLRLAVLVPPRHSKSIIVQRMLPAWIWLHRAQDQVLSLACGETLVARDGLHLRDIIRSQRYAAVIARAVERGILAEPWALRDDKSALTRFVTDAGGARAGHVINGTWVGVDADCIVIDDPIDPKDVEKGTPDMISKRMHDIREVFKNKVRDRLNSKIWGVIILIMQRLDPNDLAAHFIASGARICCLPARYEPDHPQVYDKDWRTEPGQPLNPLREPSAVLDVEEANNSYWFATKWQQRTSVRAGGLIRRTWFGEDQRYSTSPLQIAQTANEVWVSVDAAQKAGKKNDRHAIHVWARKGHLKYLLYRWADKVNYPEFERKLDAVILTWASLLTRGGVLIEDAANGAQYLVARKSGIPAGARRVVVNLLGFQPGRDTPGSFKGKDIRAGYIVSAAECGQIMLPQVHLMPGVEDMLDEWCAFPNGDYDDEVDAASQILMRWATRTAMTPEQIRYYTG